MNTRRGFLKSLAMAGGGTVATASHPTLSRRRPRPAPGGVPRHIIHLVADGMGSGIIACANHFSHLTRHRELTWLGLVRRPGTVYAMMDVRSQDSLVTDSSASASAWGSGVRIPNGKVNQSSTGGRLVTLYELMGAAGWQRGLVTTTEVTHATPAGFAACVKSRNDGEDIALQYHERGIEVILGGGRKHFDGKARKDKRDLKAEFARKGYAVLGTPSDVASAPKYAGKDYVNPGSEILSAEMMLRHMGWVEAADLIIRSMERAIASKKVTYDFARLMEGATQVSCSGFGQVMIDHM